MDKPGNTLFDFDRPTERRGSSSLKWDKYRGHDIIPMWVADMDFKAPPAVLDALHGHINHGIFGYTLPGGELVETVISMLARDHAWEVRPEWLVWLPGLVTGINVSCRSTGEQHDAVMTTIPAYPPFLSAPGLSNRSLTTVMHFNDGSRYQFDFENMERSISPRTRLFILSNPHNPTGRVFSRHELLVLAEMCLRHRIIICSDEIHCGLILDEEKSHISIAAMDEEIARNTITLLAPSKTYNLPGLGCSFAVIPDSGLRSLFKNTMQGIVPHVNALGYTAALAAYRDSEDWHLALVEYLRFNRALVEDFAAKTPGLEMNHIEATYLAWIDCRGLDVEDPVAFFESAGVGLMGGLDFGVPGFVRLNFGCTHSLLVQALERMEAALKNLDR